MNRHPGHGMPFPVMMPPWMMTGYSEVERMPQTPTEIPPRVRVAMELIRFFHQKTAPGVAVNDVSFHDVREVKLNETERRTEMHAFTLLSNYFNGTLKPCVWDRPLKQRKQEGKGAKEPQVPGINLKIKCPNCSGRPNQIPNGSCQVCCGMGFVYVMAPVAGADDDHDVEE